MPPLNRALATVISTALILTSLLGGNPAHAVDEDPPSSPAGDQFVISPVPLTPDEVRARALGQARPTDSLGPKIGPLPRQKWDSCSVFDGKFHKVTYFGGGVNLLCGSASEYGYRHIKAEHMSQFKDLARYDRVSWEDLMYWSIWYAINRPQAIASNTRTQKACRSYQLLYYNPRGTLAFTRVFRTIYMWNKPAGSQPPSGTIITALPDRRGHCDRASVSR